MLGEDELKDAVLVILCNKQDLPNAMSVQVCKKPPYRVGTQFDSPFLDNFRETWGAFVQSHLEYF